VVTVAVSYVDLGSANTFVAIAVATVKASLVATFFMHLRHDHPFNAIIFIAAFVFLGVFIFLTNDDLTTRTAVDRDNGGDVYGRNGESAPGGFQLRPVPATPAPAAGHTEPAHGEHH
jgi:cytochrome c oxidase subunit 4